MTAAQRVSQINMCCVPENLLSTIKEREVKKSRTAPSENEMNTSRRTRQYAYRGGINMREDFISEYVRDYYRNHNITLTDWQRAALICDDAKNCKSLTPWEEITEELRELADSTCDKELKSEIERFVSRSNKLIEKFTTNGGESVYITQDGSVFDSCDKALEAGMMYNKEFLLDIKKVPINETDGGTLWNTYRYDGELLLMRDDQLFSTDFKMSKIENFDFVNPYKRGDFIRENNTVYVVEGELSSKNGFITAAHVDSFGGIESKSVFSLYCDKMDKPCIYGDARDDLLQSIGDIFCGRGRIGDVYRISKRIYRSRKYLPMGNQE